MQSHKIPHLSSASSKQPLVAVLRGLKRLDAPSIQKQTWDSHSVDCDAQPLKPSVSLDSLLYHRSCHRVLDWNTPLLNSATLDLELGRLSLHAWRSTPPRANECEYVPILCMWIHFFLRKTKQPAEADKKDTKFKRDTFDLCTRRHDKCHLHIIKTTECHSALSQPQSRLNDIAPAPLSI